MNRAGSSVMSHSPDPLEQLLADRTGVPVPADVAAMAEAVAAPLGDAVLAVLAYGSCLRGVSTSDSLIDLYCLVDDYARIHAGRLARLANRLLPPNVYYAETPHDGRLLRTKYAVVTLSQFERRVAASTANPYFWARFAQPTALVSARDAATRARVVAALATAVRTALAHARGLDDTADGAPRRLWTGLFRATYRTELRSEGAARAAQIYDANADYYEAVTAAASARGGPAPNTSSWVGRRLAGKLLSVARLVKAAFTFTGGADYLAWKIARHSGVDVELTAWQRRHPILAAIVLVPKLYWRGGFR